MELILSKTTGIQLPTERIDYIQFFARLDKQFALEFPADPQVPLTFVVVSTSMVVFERYAYRIGVKEGMFIEDAEFILDKKADALLGSSFYTELSEDDQEKLNELFAALAKARQRKFRAESDFESMAAILANAPDSDVQMNKLRKNADKRTRRYDEVVNSLNDFIKDQWVKGEKMDIKSAQAAPWWNNKPLIEFYDLLMEGGNDSEDNLFPNVSDESSFMNNDDDDDQPVIQQSVTAE